MNYVVGFLFTPERDRVVLVKKNRPNWQSGKYNGVGGKVEVGEDFREAMVREFKEETGVEVSSWDHFGELEGKDFRIALYRAFDGEAFENVRTVTDEEIHKVYLDLNWIRERSIPNVSWLIGAALDPDQPGFFLRADYGPRRDGSGD